MNSYPNLKTQSTSQEQRLYYLDFLRILATVSVVIIHILTNRTDEVSYLNTMLNSLSRYCVPMFVMISGCFFLDNDKELTLKKLFGKNILRLVLCYLFWTAVYSGLFYLYQKQIDLIAGYHLWFLPMMTGLYMLSPILRCITQNTAVTRYFILVFFVAFLLCFNFFNSSVFSFPYFVKYTYDKMSEGLSLFYYPLYFVVGYYLHKFTLNKYFFRVVYVFGILSTVLLPVTAVICTIRQESTSLLFSYFFVLVFGESVFLFLSVRMLFDKIHFGEKFLAVISFLSKYTFGIYLVHIAVISLVKKTDVLAPLLFQIIAVFLISLLISFLLKHIPFIGKYLM